VVRLFRFVESEQGAAIVMEAINGVSLKAVLGENGALAPEAALLVLKGSLLGLAAAHAVGVVHRDYKPANVVVQADGLSKLVDFGVAVLAGEGSLAGTPAYMAPEQWRGEPCTPATDVYAATCVFVECVTGRRPYAGGERGALMHQHLNAPVGLDDVPEPLRPLVLRGMAKEPLERPAGAAAFVAELEAAAVAAYGSGWERQGVRALAAGAVALAALFPLGAMAVAPGATAAAAGAGAGAAGAGAGAGAGGAAAGGGAAGTVASKSFLATAAGKGVLAAATTTVVAAAATGVAIHAKSDSSKDVPPPVAVVRLAAQNERIADPNVLVRNAQYVTVGGLGDPALERRINQALRAPLDRLITIGRASAARLAANCAGRPTTVRTVAETGLRGPRLVSVRYELLSDWCQQADGSPGGEVVTVDLRTGRRLTAADVFLPSTLTPAGIGTLQSRLTQRVGQGRLYEECDRGDPAFEPADFQPQKATGEQLPGMQENPPLLSAFPTAGEFQLAWIHGGSDGCGKLTFGASYAQVRDLLKPSFVALLP